MRNLKISMKLIVSFLTVIMLAIVVAVVGIIGMQNIRQADEDMYDMNLVAIEAIGQIKSTYYDERVQVRNLVLYDAASATFQSAVKALDTANTSMSELMATYEPLITDDSDRQNFATIKSKHTEFRQMVEQVKALAQQNEMKQAQSIIDTVGTPIAAALEEAIDTCVNINNQTAKAAVTSNGSLATTMVIVEVGVLAFAVLVSMLLAFYISGLIAKPVTKMVDAANQIAVGDMDVNTDYDSKDEIGVMAQAFTKMVEGINQQVKVVQTLAEGDLTAEVHPRGAKDIMGNSLVKLLDSLNNMFGEINNSTAQVSTGSKQIADGAQALAQGSTEQAAAVEQLSSSISEVASKTKENAVMAEKAASLAGTIKGNAEKGSIQMGQMMQAVKEIGEASNSISKVIKVIDDIAFQTNILALNAAVEAARAGQHGKGFAVVAEEVRNLAAKSAEAAKDTGSLIANSMEKAQLGQRIAEETSSSLEEIVAGINESSIIVSDIATSSEEQNVAITQINKGIDQVAQVVQQNSATAEESAAASEEMSGQANVLEELIGQFKLKGGSSYSPALAAPRRGSSKQLNMPAKNVQSYAPPTNISNDDFGKY